MSISTIVDLTKIQITNAGSGNFSLGSAAPGFRGIEALTPTASYSYTVQQDGNWEIGQGTFIASPPSFIRRPAFSSNGNAPVSFTSGALLTITILAEDFAVGFDPTGIVSQAIAALLAGAYPFTGTIAAPAIQVLPQDGTSVSVEVHPGYNDGNGTVYTGYILGRAQDGSLVWYIGGQQNGGPIRFINSQNTGHAFYGGPIFDNAAPVWSGARAISAALTQQGQIAPVGNTPATMSLVNLTGDDSQQEGQRVFLFSSGGNFSTGHTGDSTYQYDRVVHYAGAVVGGLVKNAWVRNDLITINPPAQGGGYNFLNGYELDVNFSAGVDFNTALGDLGAPSCYAMHVNGAGSNTFTAAYAIINSRSNIGTNHLVQHGYVVGPGATAQSDFYSVSNSIFCLWDRGQGHAVGVELPNAYSVAAIRVQNGQSISSYGPAAGLNTKTVRMISYDANNNLHIGDTSATSGILLEGTTIPITDNAFSIGNASSRFSAVYAVNGQIQTSDAELKMDIEDIDPAKASILVDEVAPKTYRWKVGGQKLVEQQVEREVQDTEILTGSRPVVSIIDGKPVEGTEEYVQEKLVFDDVGVVDETGAPVMETVRVPKVDAAGKPVTEPVTTQKRDEVGNPVFDENGSPVLVTVQIPVTEAITRQKTHPVPRMVTKTVTEMAPEEVAGKRTHFGVLACDLKAAFQKAGFEDFGGYVMMEDGTEGYRADQLLAVVLTEVKSLRARVLALESKALPA